MGAGAIEALLRARFNVRKRLRAVSHLAGSVFFDLFDRSKLPDPKIQGNSIRFNSPNLCSYFWGNTLI